MINKDPIFLIVDLFCGFGGTTTGFESALYVSADGSLQKAAKVIACVNHDPKAIKSHWLNHPDVKHFEEDIRSLNLSGLKKIVEYWREKYPNAYVVLWASLECTNFSKAKGGQARDADSRTLALHLYKYERAIRPDFIKIENVVEFLSWGPMVAIPYKTAEGYEACSFEYKSLEVPLKGTDGLYCLNPDGSIIYANKLMPTYHGRPNTQKNGSDWLCWKETMNKLGFYDSWKQLNSADFGAYTSRNRLFGCFAKTGLPIAWPEPTHSKIIEKGRKNYYHQQQLFGNGLKPWKAVKDVLDFDDEGESIFNRKKDLVPATLERIYAGLVKYIASGDTSFISKYFSGRPAGKVNSVNAPSATITTAGNISLVQTNFLLKYNSINGKTGVHHPPSIEDPAPVIACQNRLGLVQTSFIAQRNTGEPSSKISGIDSPARTLTSTAGNQDVVNVQGFLTQYYSGGGQHSSIDSPCPTIPTKDRVSLVNPEYFIDKHFGASAQNQSIHQPAGVIMTNDKHRLIEATPFIMPTNYDNTPKSITSPCPTITANRKHHYIVNPSHGGHSTSTENPCPVIIARQDKAPLYLVQGITGHFSIPIYDTDCEVMVKIKQFMAAYGLVDIKMRMLRVPELLKIQGFPEGYKMIGSQADHKKFIGNSVVPGVVKVWAEEMANKCFEKYKDA